MWTSKILSINYKHTSLPHLARSRCRRTYTLSKTASKETFYSLTVNKDITWSGFDASNVVMVVFHVPVFAMSLQHFHPTLTHYTTAMLIHNATHMIAFR